MSRALAAEVRIREVWAWSMYDFANSGYTTVVITAVYGAYFVSAISQNAPWATFAWTAALSVSYALILVTGPLVGAWADAHAAKKKLLLLSTAGCVLFTALLAFVSPGQVALALALIAASNYFFGTGENLIAAFLPELADSRAMGRVSGWGWSFGYVGGLVALGICLAYILSSGKPATSTVPVTMLITAAFFAAAATPTFLYLHERALPQPSFDNPWTRVKQTLREMHKYADLRRFRHLPGVAAEDLNRDRPFLLGVLRVLERPVDAADQPFRADHLRDDEPAAAVPLDEAAEGAVGHAGHRRHGKR